MPADGSLDKVMMAILPGRGGAGDVSAAKLRISLACMGLGGASCALGVSSNLASILCSWASVSQGRSKREEIKFQSQRIWVKTSDGSLEPCVFQVQILSFPVPLKREQTEVCRKSTVLSIKVQISC